MSQQLHIPPVVSIGMPVYNGEQYIKEAIDSLLSQTFKNFELIISDNCSTDETANICKEYERTDHRVKYIRQERNIGPSANFEFVFKKSSCSYFMWAAHDDKWDPNWLEVLLSDIKPDDLGIRGTPITIDENGNILRTTHISSFMKGEVIKAFWDEEKNAKAFYWYALFNRANLIKANLTLLDESVYGADSALIVHLVQYGNLRTTDATHQYYREHRNSVSGKLMNVWFDFKKLEYHFFPFSYYLYSYKIVSRKYKLLLVLSMPIKYLHSQLVLMGKAFKKLQNMIFG